MESFNGRLRDELLNRELFLSLAEPATVQRALVRLVRSDMIETGGGRSVAANAAVAPVALRAPSATAAATLPMAAVPPYSRLETAQRMGTG